MNATIRLRARVCLLALAAVLQAAAYAAGPAAAYAAGPAAAHAAGPAATHAAGPAAAQTAGPAAAHAPGKAAAHAAGPAVVAAQAAAAAVPATAAPRTSATAPLIALVLPRDEQNLEAGFRDHLARHGLAPRYEVVRWSGRDEDQPALVARLRALAPQLVYTWGTPTTLAVAGPARLEDVPPGRTHIRDLPVVFTEVTDPVGSGLVADLARPRRNVTGVRHLAPLPVQLAAMLGYRPFRRIGVIVNPAEVNTKLVRDALGPLAAAQGLQIVDATVPTDARGAPDATALPALVADLKARGAEVLYLGPSTFLAYTHRDLVTGAARDAGLPTFCATESAVRQSGCLFGLFSNGANTGRFAAYKALQILQQGRRADELPIETLQRFSLLINMPVARALDLYPPLLLLDVAEVLPVSVR